MKGKQKNKTILIVDGNNLLFRCYFKFSGMVSKKGVPSSMVFGYPYVLKSLIGKFKPIKVFNVFDGGRSRERLRILPTYKQKDPKLGFDIDDFRVQKEEVMKLVSAINTDVVWKKYQEADDLIYMLVRKYQKTHNVVIVSSDKDFNQLVSEKVICHNPHKGIEITLKNMKHRFGYEAHECVDYLILDGDNSDNIPGYKGMGEKRIREFLDMHSSIKNYLSSNMQYKSINNALLADIYRRNKYLIDLAYYYRKFNRKMKIPVIYFRNVFDKYYLWEIADKYDITTFKKKDFIETFKQIKR